jgi:hypothetical protein
MTKITTLRKAIYYIGIGMVVFGFMPFIYELFQIGRFMNNPFEYNDTASYINLVFGMASMVAGTFVMLGTRGTTDTSLLIVSEKGREGLKVSNKPKEKETNDAASNVDNAKNKLYVVKKKRNKKMQKLKCNKK